VSYACCHICSAFSVQAANTRGVDKEEFTFKTKAQKLLITITYNHSTRCLHGPSNVLTTVVIHRQTLVLGDGVLGRLRVAWDGCHRSSIHNPFHSIIVIHFLARCRRPTAPTSRHLATKPTIQSPVRRLGEQMVVCQTILSRTKNVVWFWSSIWSLNEAWLSLWVFFFWIQPPLLLQGILGVWRREFRAKLHQLPVNRPWLVAAYESENCLENECAREEVPAEEQAEAKFLQTHVYVSCSSEAQQISDSQN